MLGLGVGAVVWAPTAALFGRRPVYVAGSVLLIASSAWAAASPSYASLVIARLVQGAAASPGEFLVSVTISEIYQPHERGFRLGVYMLLLAAGKSLAPLIGAGVIQGLGWRWVLWYVYLKQLMDELTWTGFQPFYPGLRLVLYSSLQEKPTGHGITAA